MPLHYQTAGEPFFRLRSVSFSYNGISRALDGVSLDVRSGERIAVLGHNGSGKSTLAKIMGALHTPLQGACFICGRDAREIPARELRRTVGFVGQNAAAQIFGSTVETDAAFAPENLGFAPSEIRERVDAVLETAGLSNGRHRDVSLLSAEERQMLAIAGALAAGASCLILDEVTAMLGSDAQRTVNALLRTLHASGMTIIEITHRLDCIDEADGVIVMEGGRIIWLGEPNDFWRCAESLGFELPPKRRILSRMASLDIIPKSELIEDISREIVFFASEKEPVIPNCKNENTARSFIDVRGLSLLQGGVRILDSVNASFPRGCRTSITGRSGSGKSSLMLHINGLNRIQSGRILIDGADIPQRGRKLLELRRRVGLIMQFPEQQLFMNTVYDELAFAPHNFGARGRELNDAVMFGLESAGLSEDFLSRNPLELSGGERRLAAAASVFAARPECVMIDEPFAGLDAVYRRRLDETLGRLTRSGMTVITASDDAESAFIHADRILVMQNGAAAAEGAPCDVLPNLVRAGASLSDVVKISYSVNQMLPHIPITADCDEFMRSAGLEL